MSASPSQSQVHSASTTTTTTPADLSSIKEPEPTHAELLHEHPAHLESEGRLAVFGWDPSDSSSDALEWVFKNLIRDGDKLTIVSALSRPFNEIMLEGYTGATDISTEEQYMLASTVQHVTRAVQKLALESPRHIRVFLKVKWGDVRDVLTSVCGDLKPDFLVVGSHGKGTFRSLLLGSTSNYLLNHCKIPVIVIRKSHVEIESISDHQDSAIADTTTTTATSNPTTAKIVPVETRIDEGKSMEV